MAAGEVVVATPVTMPGQRERSVRDSTILVRLMQNVPWRPRGVARHCRPRLALGEKTAKFVGMPERPIGHHHWAIADGYIPEGSHGPEPEMTSHDTACLLNTSIQDAQVTFTVYFADRDPVGPYHVTVPPRRTRHVRFNDFTDPEPIPRATDFACVIESDQPIVVQHTRLDSRQAENALMTTIAYPA